MSKHRDDIVLKDILNAAQLIVAFVDGVEKDAFVDDWKNPFGSFISIDGHRRNSALRICKSPGR